MSFSVLVVDDQTIVRLGVSSMFQGSPLMVVAEAETIAQAIELVGRGKIDLILMESRLAGRDALHGLQQIKFDFPQIPVLVFSACDNPVFVARSNLMGASGYLLKGISREELVQACMRAMSDESIWTSEEMRRVTGAMGTPRLGIDVDVPLTNREIQVLRHLCEGATNKEIALKLEISYETVKEHVQHVLRKVNVSDRTQAAVWAVRLGLF